MKKTSLYLEPELDEALARRAADEGLSKAEFIRRGLAMLVQRPPRAKPSVGIMRTGLGDLSERAEEYLEHDLRRP